MEFLKRIHELGLINEEGAPPPPGSEAPEEGAPAVTDPVPETDTMAVLSPESEVMYVRLLKKAMVMDIDPVDIDNINEMAEVNENNAKEVLASIVSVMKSYTTEIDLPS